MSTVDTGFSIIWIYIFIRLEEKKRLNIGKAKNKNGSKNRKFEKDIFKKSKLRLSELYVGLKWQMIISEIFEVDGHFGPYFNIPKFFLIVKHFSDI